MKAFEYEREFVMQKKGGKSFKWMEKIFQGTLLLKASPMCKECQAAVQVGEETNKGPRGQKEI